MLGSMTNHKSFAQERFDTNCSDLEVQINYYNPPFAGFDQRLEDMRVTDTLLGITALRQPVINSIKTSYTYAWGSQVKVFKRTKFGTIIWYQVGASGSTTPQGWIPVVYTAPNFLTSYFIGTPPIYRSL